MMLPSHVVGNGIVLFLTEHICLETESKVGELYAFATWKESILCTPGQFIRLMYDFIIFIFSIDRISNSCG